MPDATYVGAGMPCGNCGNPLTAGQPHKCGRTPDQPCDDGTHGNRWLAGKLPPDKEVVLAHHYDALLAAASPDERLREAAERLLVAFAAEEDEHGFPFSFELRDAHRALVAATDRDKPGQRPWATDEDYAAEHAEKPKRNHAPWCEGGHGDTPCPATDREKPETDT